MPPGDIAPVFVTTMLAVCASAVLILRGPLGRAVEAWVRGKRGGGDPAVSTELEELHGRVEAMQGLEQRVYELEERLEFAERLLAQPRNAVKAGD